MELRITGLDFSHCLATLEFRQCLVPRLESEALSSHPPIIQRLSQELLLDEETEEVTTVKDKERNLAAFPKSPCLKATASDFSHFL